MTSDPYERAALLRGELAFQFEKGIPEFLRSLFVEIVTDLDGVSPTSDALETLLLVVRAETLLNVLLELERESTK